MTDIKKELKVLRDAFIQDPEFAQTWITNLAMAFYDSYPSEPTIALAGLHRAMLTSSQKAAKSFMKLAFDYSPGEKDD